MVNGRGLDLNVFWIVTQNVSDNLNVTVGNFLGYDIHVTLNVSGSIKELDVENGKTNSEFFTSPPSEFELGLNFNTTQKNLLLEKYKANIYFILEMRKGDEKITGETKA